MERVRINSCDSVLCEPAWRWDPSPERFVDLDLWYVWSGVGTMAIDGVSLPVHRGSVFVLRPGHEYHATHDRQRRLGVCYVHFDLLDPHHTPLRYRDADLPAHHADVREPDLYERLLRRVIELHQSNWVERKDAANRLLESVLLSLPGDIASPRDDDANRLREARIAEVMRHIREHPGELFTISDLADRASYATDHFTRVFQQVAGVSPKEFCIRARIERAQHLLRDSDMTVSDVADALGYADVFFFSRQFKSRTGLTPTQWRQRRSSTATSR